jgi:hypothetical protein
MTIGGLALLLLCRTLYGWPLQRADLVSRGLYIGSALLYATFGLLIALRQHHNPIGWLLFGLALSPAIQGLAEEYALYTLAVNPGALPGGNVSGWVAQWSWALTIICFPLMILLFPTGRLLSPRWRFVAWLAVAFGLLCAVLGAIAPGNVKPTDEINVYFANPLAVTDDEVLFYRFFNPFWSLFFPPLLLLVVLSLILRFRRAQGQERQQLKWFTYALVWAVADELWGSYLFGVWATAVTNLSFYGVMAAVGLAILRYRLYDIDLIIRRTLIYSVLTGLLALVYFGSVMLFQQLLRLWIGSGETPLVTVASTLALAALFTPLHRRVQQGIDRRFYRRKYNAEQVLATFAETVRHETDLEKLSERLVAVVKETMQPAQVSLWLKSTGDGRHD